MNSQQGRTPVTEQDYGQRAHGSDEGLLPAPATPGGVCVGLRFSVLAVLAIVAVVALGLLVVGAPLPLMMAIGFGVALLVAALARVPYRDAERLALDLVRRGLQPVLIFVAVGALISAWIHSGTVPSMIYYGMQLISPGWFLPTALILCAVTSLLNGTNFATVATIGLALMGVATALGIPAGVAAGAIICGAIFGDKMSPLSDTTVMTPGLAGAELFSHIRHMMWTTVPAILVSLVVFAVVGLGYDTTDAGVDRVAEASAGLADAFKVGLVPLLPPLVVLALLLLKVEAFPAIGLGALSAVPVAVWYQGAELTIVLGSMWNGYTAPEGLGDTAQLLAGGESGGGLKLLGLASIVVFALGIAGALASAGVLQTLLATTGRRLSTPARLVSGTLGITVVLNLVGGAVNFAAAMGATALRPLYRAQDIAPKNLSRAVEDAANTTGPLIPWNATAVFTSAALGVSVATYAPWLIFCFLTPLISLAYAVTGFTITRGPGAAPLDHVPDNR